MKKAITVLVISLLSCINAMAVQSGKCGDNATWTLSDDSVLTISGTGEIEKFDIDKNKVKKVIIEDGITNIGRLAFHMYRNLREVIIANSVVCIEDYALGSCYKLKKIIIPDSLKKIGYRAFSECEELSEITIPNTVEEIGGFAFYMCDNLKFNIYDSACYLGNKENPYYVLINPTYKEASLNKIVDCHINERCKIIPEWAFVLSSIRSVIIPESIKVLGNCAFCNTQLKSIICNTKIPPATTMDIGFEEKKITLYVPKESIKAYKKADGWRNFKKIKAIESLNKK